MDQVKDENKPAPDVKAANGAPSESEREKERSGTSYPYYGLSRGIEIVSAVRKAGGSEASNADVMRELGVTKVTERTWAYGVPTAIQFGLIERVGRGDDGRLKLTELATRIALPATPEEARLAKVAAFKTPDLYVTLLEKFAGHPVPTKDGLKNILHRDFKIVESMAPIAADAFFDSLKVAELISPTNTIGDGGAQAKPAGDQGVKDEPVKPKPGTQSITVPDTFTIYKCKLTSIKQAIDLPLPATLTRADANRIYAFLLTQVDDGDVVGADFKVTEVKGETK